MTLASIVEGKEMAQTVVASILAGLGVTFIFSLAIYGATRFADLNRDERPVAAAAAGALAVLALATTIASVVIGVIVMTTK